MNSTRLRSYSKKEIENLYMNYSDYILRIASASSHPSPEDVLHEVFFNLLSKKHGYDESKGAITTWLYTITKNRIKTDLRSLLRKRERSLEEAVLIPDADLNPEKEAISKDEARFIEYAISRLPERYREIIGYTISGKKSKEISKIMEIPGRTVRDNLDRARKLIKSALNKRSHPNFNPIGCRTKTSSKPL